jgi:hydrogenase-4 component F
MENIGLVVLAFGLGGPGIFAGLLHALNHSLVKALMFCTTGNILIKYRSRNLDQVKGMLQAIPATSALLFLGALALVGTPPFNIFLSKFLIITSGMQSYIWLMLLILLMLAVVFAAFFRVISSTLFGEKPEGMQKKEYNWLTLLPPAVLIILMLVLGVFIPPQLNALLNGASNIMTTGSPVFQTTTSFWQSWPGLIAVKAILSPLLSWLP